MRPSDKWELALLRRRGKGRIIGWSVARNKPSGSPLGLPKQETYDRAIFRWGSWLVLFFRCLMRLHAGWGLVSSRYYSLWKWGVAADNEARWIWAGPLPPTPRPKGHPIIKSFVIWLKATPSSSLRFCHRPAVHAAREKVRPHAITLGEVASNRLPRLLL